MLYHPHKHLTLYTWLSVSQLHQTFSFEVYRVEQQHKLLHMLSMHSRSCIVFMITAHCWLFISKISGGEGVETFSWKVHVTTHTCFDHGWNGGKNTLPITETAFFLHLHTGFIFRGVIPDIHVNPSQIYVDHPWTWEQSLCFSWRWNGSWNNLGSDTTVDYSKSYKHTESMTQPAQQCLLHAPE